MLFNKPSAIWVAPLAIVAACTTLPADRLGLDAAIPFANQGGIRNWRPLDESTLLIEDQSGHYYLARLASPSSGLVQSEAIGFITSAGGTFDRFSTVLIKGVRHGLRSFDKTDPLTKGGPWP